MAFFPPHGEGPATPVSNVNLANVATQTVKGRVAAGTGSPTDLTRTQLTTLVDIVGATQSFACSAAPGAAADRYLALTEAAVTTTQRPGQITLPLNCTIQGWRADVLGTPLATDSLVVCPQVSGSDIGTPQTIAAAGTTAGQTGLSVAYTAGTPIGVRVHQSSTEAQANYGLRVTVYYRMAKP